MPYIIAAVIAAAVIIADVISSHGQTQTHPAQPWEPWTEARPTAPRRHPAVIRRALAALDKIRHPYRNPYRLRPYRRSQHYTSPGQYRRPGHPISSPGRRAQIVPFGKP